MFTYKYPRPALTSDSVVFGFDGRELHILLIERGVEPYKGWWALPGGFMKMEETIEECAKRELREETGISPAYLEQFKVYSAVSRDPRGRVVSVAFFALVRKSDFNLVAGDDAVKARWFACDSLPQLAFDHASIIADARNRLRQVALTSPIPFNLLDKSFSMSELQRIIELLTGHSYDRRNFARKMGASGRIEETSEQEAPGKARNAYTLARKAFDDDSFWEPKF